MPTKRELGFQLGQAKIDLARTRRSMDIYRERGDDLADRLAHANSFIEKVIEVYGLTEGYPPEGGGIGRFISDVETVYENDRQIAELSEATKRLKGK